jgi:hypothetical protein
MQGYSLVSFTWDEKELNAINEVIKYFDYEIHGK